MRISQFREEKLKTQVINHFWKIDLSKPFEYELTQKMGTMKQVF